MGPEMAWRTFRARTWLGFDGGDVAPVRRLRIAGGSPAAATEKVMPLQ
jgi:hypothetical protein